MPLTGNKKFILASGSPRRKELLSGCGIDFTVQIPQIVESDSGDDLYLIPQKNAELKASEVAAIHPDAWILGADTMIIFGNRVVGKPADLTQAAQFLREFSGKSHEVVTGMALIHRAGNICEVWSESSLVHFKKLSDEVIRQYLSLVPVLDKAGAYAIQEHGELIVEEFSGELENIVGLPLKKLQKLLTGYSIVDRF